MARQITRYENRKLYDTTGKTYVSLTDIAALVRAGETVEIIDRRSGKDLTAQILTQVILEEGKRGTALIPSDLLHTLLRRGERALDTGLEQVRSGVGSLVHSSLNRVQDLLGHPAVEDLAALRAQLSSLERILDRLTDTLPEGQGGHKPEHNRTDGGEHHDG